MRRGNRFTTVFFIAVAVVMAAGTVVSGQPRAKSPRQAMSPALSAAATVQTNCTATAMPDIVLVKVAVSGGQTGKWAPGQTCQVTAVLENRGQCETGSFKVQISVYAQDMTANKVEDKVILTRQVPSMQPTRDKEPSYTRVTADYTLGPDYKSTYDFYASADPENKVNEFIENNNAIEKQMGGKDAFIEVK